MKDHLDGESGMMVTEIDPQTGQIIDGPRGCALSWALAFLPQLDPGFAQSQFKLFRSNWFVPFAGMLGIHEWYKAKEKSTMFHAGPVICGLGAAASGIGIATCRANGDYASWHQLLRSLETLGFPLWTPARERSYFWGNCLLADVLALWGKTVCRWDNSNTVPAGAASQQVKSDPDYHFLVTVLMACLLSAAIIFVIIRHIVFLARDKTLIRPGWHRATTIAFALQLMAAVAFLFSPAISWMQVLIFMLVVDLLEELTIRPRIVSAIFYGTSSGT
jgi:hypothetical protein